MSSSDLARQQYTREVDRYFLRNAIAIMIDNSMFYIIALGLSQYTILPLYLSKLTSSTILLGLIPTLAVVGMALPQLFVARFLKGKRRTKKYILATALVQRLSILAFLVLTLVQTHLPAGLTVVLFFLIYAIQNLITGCWFPMWVEFIGRAVPRKRGMVFGLSYLIGGVFSLLGGILITYLLEALPYPNAISAAAGIAVLASLVSLAAIVSWHEVPLPEPEGPAAAGAHSPFHRVRLDRGFRSYLAWRGVITGVEMCLSYVTVSALLRLQAADSQAGIFATILALSQTVMNVFWGWLGDRIGYLKIVIWASLLGAAGALLAASAGSLLLFYLVFVLIGAMIAGQQLANINIIYEFGSHGDIPTYTAVNQLVLSPLSGAMPLIGGILVSQLGYGPLFWASGILGAAGTLGMLARVRNPFRPHPHAPSGPVPGPRASDP